MKDESRDHACPDGNDCASPPIRNNAEGENCQGGQKGDFDKCFHRRKYALAVARFPAPACRNQTDLLRVTPHDTNGMPFRLRIAGRRIDTLA
jgi:hypothetical protein